MSLLSAIAYNFFAGLTPLWKPLHHCIAVAHSRGDGHGVGDIRRFAGIGKRLRHYRENFIPTIVEVNRRQAGKIPLGTREHIDRYRLSLCHNLPIRLHKGGIHHHVAAVQRLHLRPLLLRTGNTAGRHRDNLSGHPRRPVQRIEVKRKPDSQCAAGGKAHQRDVLRPVALCHLPVALKHHLIGFCDTVVCTERIVWEPAVGAATDSKIPRCLNIALVRTDDHPTSEQVQDRLFCPLLSQLNGKAVILPQDQSITVDCFMIFWHLELPSAVHPAHFLQQFFLRQREQLFSSRRPGALQKPVCIECSYQLSLLLYIVRLEQFRHQSVRDCGRCVFFPLQFDDAGMGKPFDGLHHGAIRHLGISCPV